MNRDTRINIVKKRIKRLRRFRRAQTALTVAQWVIVGVCLYSMLTGTAWLFTLVGTVISIPFIRALRQRLDMRSDDCMLSLNQQLSSLYFPERE